MITYLEFYSGIGGWGYALEEACRSITAAVAVERHPPPALSLRPKLLAAYDHSDLCKSVFCHNHRHDSNNNHPTDATSSKRKKHKRNKQHPNLRQTPIERLTLSEISEHSACVWCMSPPCQPHTRQHSNRHLERDDPRSKSFLHLCHILSELHEDSLPALILLENVVGFEKSSYSWEDDNGDDDKGIDIDQEQQPATLSSNDHDDDSNMGSFQTWRQVLSKRKYRVAHFHLDPTHVGIPNNRPRHYTVAFRRGALRQRLLLMTKEKENGSSISSDNPVFPPSLSQMIQEKGIYDHLFCPESLDKPPVIHNEIYLVKEGKTPLLQPTQHLPCVGSFLDSDLPPHAQQTSTKTPKQEMLQIPEKFRSSSSSWCYDIVTPRHHRTACFTHSYGKFIRGTGSILYTGPIKGEGAADLDDKEDLTNDIDGSGGDDDDGEREDKNNTNYKKVRLAAKKDTPSIDQFQLVPPDERTFDASWSKDLDWDNLRYLSGNEIARLMGFPVVEKPAILCNGTTCKAKAKLDVDTIPTRGERSLREFSFPPDCTMKQQWKMLGNSLNVHVAAFVAEIGIQSMLDEVR